MIAAAVLLWHFAVVLTLETYRLSAAERPFGAPVPWSADGWPVVAATAAVVALLAVGLAARRLPRGPDRRMLAELLVMPAVVLAWLWGRPATSGFHPGDVLGAVVVGSVAALLWRTTPRPPAKDPAGPGLFDGRRWRLGNVAFVALPVVVALATGARIAWSSLGISLALYPLYAFLQLALVLALPFPRLVHLAGPRAAVATCTALFALVHWPNGALMAVTAAAMAFWAAEYRRGRRLLALALSMGLAATTFTQLLPHALTSHMRVGPGYVRLRAVPALAGAAAVDPAQPVVAGFIGPLYPAAIGRPATAVELARWEASVGAARRGALAWYFFNAPEYRERFGQAPDAPRLGDATPWTQLEPAWRARVAPFATAAYARAHGDTWEGFLGGIYRDVLGREAAPADLASWPQTLSARERERLVEVLLANRGRLRRAPFDTLTAEALELRY